MSITTLDSTPRIDGESPMSITTHGSSSAARASRMTPTATVAPSLRSATLPIDATSSNFSQHIGLVRIVSSTDVPWFLVKHRGARPVVDGCPVAGSNPEAIARTVASPAYDCE